MTDYFPTFRKLKRILTRPSKRLPLKQNLYFERLIDTSTYPIDHRTLLSNAGWDYLCQRLILEYKDYPKQDLYLKDLLFKAFQDLSPHDKIISGFALNDGILIDLIYQDGHLFQAYEHHYQDDLYSQMHAIEHLPLYLRNLSL